MEGEREVDRVDRILPAVRSPLLDQHVAEVPAIGDLARIASRGLPGLLGQPQIVGQDLAALAQQRQAPCLVADPDHARE